MDEIDHNRDDGRAERAEEIEEDDGPELGQVAALRARDGGRDEQEDQDGRDALQGADEEGAQKADPCKAGHGEPQNDADRKTDTDSYDETQ